MDTGHGRFRQAPSRYQETCLRCRQPRSFYRVIRRRPITRRAYTEYRCEACGHCVIVLMEVI